MKGIQNLRVDYSGDIIQIKDVDKNPINEFIKWFDFAKSNKVIEPNAMILSTQSIDSINSRTVLLKDISEDGFTFFTNYNSRKALDISMNNIVSSVFLWKKIERQVIIKGNATKIAIEDSKKYFDSRPRNSKIAAWASKQSSSLENQDDLTNNFSYYEKKFNNQEIPYPNFWGGYLISPFSIEFWQGRSSRMHDRICYYKEEGKWKIQKLYP